MPSLPINVPFCANLLGVKCCNLIPEKPTHSLSLKSHQTFRFYHAFNRNSPQQKSVMNGIIFTRAILRLNLVNTWFSQNTFFIVFFTGTAFILFNYIIKLVLEYQFNLQNPRKQKKMWIFETNKNPLFNISLGMFSKNEVKNHVL